MDSKSAKTGFQIAHFLFLCPKRVINSPWVRYVQKLLEMPLDRIVTSLNRLLIVSNDKKDKFIKTIAEHTLDIINEKHPLQYKNFNILNIAGSERLQKITNHPVHIVDEDKVMSPSSFIPFCEFGGNMPLMGVKLDQFNFPVCNSFKPTIIDNRLCYKVDVNHLKQRPSVQELSDGLIFVLDFNEDRQFYNESSNPKVKGEKSFAKQGFKKINELIIIHTFSLISIPIR